MHVIAAKAVCFKEALSAGISRYTQQGIIDNAQALCKGLMKTWYRHCFRRNRQSSDACRSDKSWSRPEKK